MKRFWAILLILIYASGTTGATINRHYCMGRSSGWSLGQSASDHCAYCGMERVAVDGKGCCKDELSFVKTTTDHQAGVVSISTDPFSIPAAFIPYGVFTSHFVCLDTSPCSIVQPPPLPGIFKCKLHCVFRK